MLKWCVEHYKATGTIECVVAGSIALFVKIYFHLNTRSVAMATIMAIILGTPIVLSLMAPFLHRTFGVDPLEIYAENRFSKQTKAPEDD